MTDAIVQIGGVIGIVVLGVLIPGALCMLAVCMTPK
jgi:hypothetical protein